MTTAGTLRVSDNVSRVRDLGVIPIVELNSLNEAEDLFSALSEGGLPVPEITLRTTVGLEALRLLRRSHPDGFIGAGTVLTLADAPRVIEAGAQFVVSPAMPGVDRVLPRRRHARDAGRVHADRGRQGQPRGRLADQAVFGRGCQRARPTHRARRAVPRPVVRPHRRNQRGQPRRYLRVPQVAACGGSWIIPAQQLRDRDFAAILTVAREACAIVAEVRLNG